MSEAAGCEVVVVVESISQAFKHDLDVAYNFLNDRRSDWSLEQYLSVNLLVIMMGVWPTFFLFKVATLLACFQSILW